MQQRTPSPRFPVRYEVVTHTREVYVERYFYADGESFDISHPITVKDYLLQIGVPDLNQAYRARIRKMYSNGKLELAIHPPADSGEYFTIDEETYSIESFQWFLAEQSIPRLERGDNFFFWKDPAFAFADLQSLINSEKLGIPMVPEEVAEFLYQQYRSERPPHPGAIPFKDWLIYDGKDSEQADKIIADLPFPLTEEDMTPGRPLTRDEYIRYILDHGVTDGEIIC